MTGPDARLMLVACPGPGCSFEAEVTDRWAFASTEGPLAHSRTVCPAGHDYTVRDESLARAHPIRREGMWGRGHPSYDRDREAPRAG